MQFRLDLGNGNGGGFGMRRPPENPHHMVAPSFRGGFPIEFGTRVDNWRQGMPSPAARNSSCFNPSKQEEQLDEGPPSKHLWVGNVSQEITDPVIKEKFAECGDVESVTVYPSRNYAFVNFRNQEEAVNAKNRLQGAYLGGFAMRIEFAKGRTAKPDGTKGREANSEPAEGALSNKAMQSRHLWIGGLGTNTIKEQLEMELRKFGQIEEFKILRDRHCAFVDFVRLDDAIAALEGLHHKHVGNDDLRVEYGRSHSAKRKQEGRGDDRSSTPREHNCVAPEDSTVSHGASQKVGDQMAGASGKGDRDGGPSEVLWIGFPLTTKIEEQTLMSAFSTFGEIERVKTFPGRTYAFVQFKCKEDAARAKENLDGKLFSDPRVHIRFSKSEIGPVNNSRLENTTVPPWWVDDQQTSAEIMGAPLGQTVRVQSPGRYHFGSPCRNSNNNGARISGLRPEYRPESLMSGIGMTQPQGDTRSAEIGFAIPPKPVRENCFNENVDKLLGVLGGRPTSRSSYDDTWDLPDEDSMYKDSKRLRGYSRSGIDCSNFDLRSEPQQHQMGAYDTGNHARTGSKVGGYGTARMSNIECYDYGAGPRSCGGLSGTKGPLILDNVRSSSLTQGLNHSPRTAAILNGKSGVYLGQDHNGASAGCWQWHGTIAKGGTPVCRARCLLLGKNFDLTIPDVVNCTARTDLDMLAKHVFQAGDCGIAFFVPEGDPDVPPYQDFMHYLGEKHRAGVAKLADGTTLFLVPPSDFSEKVLKLPGQSCLFGVVLKFKVSASNLHQPEQGRSHPPQPPRITQQHYSSPMRSSPLQESGGSQGSSHLLSLLGQQLEVGQNENGTNFLTNSNSMQLQLASIAGLRGGLTPELLASLTALLPQKSPALPSNDSNSAPSQFSGGLNMYGLSGPAPVSAPTATAPPLSATPSKQHESMPACRPPFQSNLPAVSSQGWPLTQPCQQDPQQLGRSDQSQSSNQSSYAFMQSVLQQQQPGVQAPAHTPAAATSGVPPELSHLQQHQQQGLSGGANGQQVSVLPIQMPGPSQGAVPQLPSDQLAQLTALFTRPQQPAQQQAAAQLLHHHFQQQHQHQHQHQHQLPPPPSSTSSSQSSSSVMHFPLLLQSQQMNQMQPQQQQPPQFPPPPLRHSFPPLLQQPTQPSNVLQQLPLPQPPSEYMHSSAHSQWSPGPLSQLPSQSRHQSQPQLNMVPQHQSQSYMQKQAHTQPQGGNWENAGSKVETGVQGGGPNQGETEPGPQTQQKRFEATLQLAAALLQQMQQQQGKTQTGTEQQQ